MKKITFLVAALCATMFAGAANLVVNGDMELGTAGTLPTSFTDGGKAGFQTDATMTYDGSSFAAKCTGTNCRLEQEITVVSGKSYTFSFMYNGYSATGTNGLKNYSLIDAATSSSYIDGGTPAMLPASAAAWTEYTKTFTATSATMKVSIRAYETVYVDNISLVEEGATAINQVNMLSVYANNGTIYGAENARIYTILGMDVTEQNGNLKGIYVVKANGKTQKIAVK